MFGFLALSKRLLLKSRRVLIDNIISPPPSTGAFSPTSYDPENHFGLTATARSQSAYTGINVHRTSTNAAIYSQPGGGLGAPTNNNSVPMSSSTMGSVQTGLSSQGDRADRGDRYSDAAITTQYQQSQGGGGAGAGAGGQYSGSHLQLQLDNNLVWQSEIERAYDNLLESIAPYIQDVSELDLRTLRR